MGQRAVMHVQPAEFGAAVQLGKDLARVQEAVGVEGRNIAIEYRWAEGRTGNLAEFASEFVRLKVDVIVTSGTPPVLAAKRATSGGLQ